MWEPENRLTDLIMDAAAIGGSVLVLCIILVRSDWSIWVAFPLGMVVGAPLGWAAVFALVALTRGVTAALIWITRK